MKLQAVALKSTANRRGAGPCGAAPGSGCHFDFDMFLGRPFAAHRAPLRPNPRRERTVPTAPTDPSEVFERPGCKPVSLRVEFTPDCEVAMGLEKYRITPTSFDRYYDIFLQNSFRGRRFRITLVNGDSVEGVPTAGSIANPTDPKVSFFLRVDDGRSYQIPFADLSEALAVN